MKKLFLRSGKLMYGSSLDDQSAAEVVNLEAIGFGLSAEYKTFFIDGNEHNEPEMVDLPKGWTVEIKEACASDCCSDNGCCEHCREPVKIARLIPTSENAQGEKGAGDDYPVIEHSSHYETPDGIHGTHYGAKQSGIVATGTPEAEQQAIEAARDWSYNILVDQRRLHPQDLRDAYFEGCTFASQDTEERVKQAHNAAIDSISKLIREKSFSFTEEEIQKLKL